MMAVYTTIDSPLGELLLAAEPDPDGGVVLTSVSFRDQRGAGAIPPAWRHAPEMFEEAARQLSGYFAGELRELSVPMASAGTPFQERVWAAVDAIPYGTTTSYGKLAEQIGAPRDRIRAVAAAVGANPLLILRPCHRVVGASGSLTGYAAGLRRKHSLLTLEGALQPQLL
jgi:methylated-DNA-[protein]-cysteine S-methyltransferase